MRVVLLGPPASGKGTHGRRLASALKLDYLSTGALLRENIEERTPLGLAAEPILTRGGYLPDDLMCPVISDWLEKHPDSPGWVLDGFPRSLPQAEYLDRQLSHHGRKLDAAIALEVPFDDLLIRICNRVECPECRWSGQKDQLSFDANCPECGHPAAPRADDDEKNFRNRHAEFSELTLPVIDRYRNAGKLLSIPATAPKDEVAAAILEELGGRSGERGEEPKPSFGV